MCACGENLVAAAIYCLVVVAVQEATVAMEEAGHLL